MEADEAEFPDADAFEALVAGHELFRRTEPVYIARAPGRLDVMGGIADYSGSLVLEIPSRSDDATRSEHRDSTRNG